ncbi:MAG: hypothetical protein C0594_16265 [Marinilabiliales bacterium]|nr:MAG: hypothetical protein C0594_16265 [Marinilabiliales bacterium]
MRSGLLIFFVSILMVSQYAYAQKKHGTITVRKKYKVDVVNIRKESIRGSRLQKLDSVNRMPELLDKGAGLVKFTEDCFRDQKPQNGNELNLVWGIDNRRILTFVEESNAPEIENQVRLIETYLSNNIDSTFLTSNAFVYVLKLKFIPEK